MGLKLSARFEKHFLNFKKPAGTSRGILHEKPCWYLFIKNIETGVEGIGECSIIPGLSIDPLEGYEEKLAEVCKVINLHQAIDLSEILLHNYPSIYLAIEMAMLDLQNGGKKIYYFNDFTDNKIGIPINGLIWMDTIQTMWEQTIEKVAAGYKVIKLKIGALNFREEVNLIAKIRNKFPDITLRLDANGAFEPAMALEALKSLAPYHIHSIEQPIKQGQWEAMKDLCKSSPIPMALDEELIGIDDSIKKGELLKFIKPSYIIIKPSLLGGFAAADEWISLAEENNIQWWITSALESNIGLDAIAQWTASKNITMAQGLGTGALYTNNVPSTLHIREGYLYH